MTQDLKALAAELARSHAAVALRHQSLDVAISAIESAILSGMLAAVQREPSEEECFAAGKGPAPGIDWHEGGLPNTPQERARFESYMRGHCWAFNYDSATHCYDDTIVRMLYGVWRDRGWLTAELAKELQDGR